MKKPAKVKFIGNPNDYKIYGESWGQQVEFSQTLRFDEDGLCLNEEPIKTWNIEHKGNPSDFICAFAPNAIYHAYFLEYWQGERDNLHVRRNDGEVTDFIPFGDFEVIEDQDGVLNTYEATVRCITHKFDGSLFEPKFGKEYLAIGITNKQFSDLDYLVMDDSHDCYFYSHTYFEIIEDKHKILDPKDGLYVYDLSLFSE